MLFTLLKVDNIHGGWSLQVNKKILNVNQQIHGKIPLTPAGRVHYQQDYSVYILLCDFLAQRMLLLVKPGRVRRQQISGSGDVRESYMGLFTNDVMR